MAIGLPCVATASGGPESFIDEDMGIVSESDDPQVLAKELLNVIQNLDEYNPEKIRKKIVDNYSQDKVGGKLIEVYKQILS